MNFLDTLEYIDDQCGHWQRQASPLTVRITSPGFDSNGEQGTSTWACTDCAPVVIALFDREYGGHDEHPKVTKTAEQPAQLALGDADRYKSERDEARAWGTELRDKYRAYAEKISGGYPQPPHLAPWEEST